MKSRVGPLSEAGKLWAHEEAERHRYFLTTCGLHVIRVGIYVRKTEHQNKDGSVAEYYQLAHNVRRPQTRNTLAKVLYNFGRGDALERDELKRLCRSIARVCGLEMQDPLGPPRESGCPLTAGI